jgi:DHA1 family multidrug resistance protein-like MFS transporter
LVKKEIIFLCSSTIAVMLGFGVVSPILPQYILTFGVTYTMAGITVSAFPLARMFLNFPSGILTDRVGRRKILLIGIFIVTLGAMFCGLARSIYELIAFRFLYGMGTAMFIVAANVIVADMAPPDERGKYLSYYQGSFRFGSILGPAIGGFIADAAGLRSPFFILSALGLVSFALSFFLIREDTRPLEGESKTSVNLASLLKLMLDRRLMTIELMQLLSFLTMSSIRATMVPLYGVNFLGLSLSDIGTLLSAGAIVSLPILLLMSNVVDRIKRNRIISFGFILLAIAVYSYTLADSFEDMLLATLLLSIAQVLINPSKVAIIGDITTRETRGLALGAFRTAGDIGFFIGPSLAGYMTDNIGVLWPFRVVAILCLIGSTIALYSLRKSKLRRIVSIE